MCNNRIKGQGDFMKKWVIVVLIIALFVVSVICGFIINSFTNFSKKEEQNHAVLADNEKEKTIDTSSYDITISPNAEVISMQKFGKCGHTTTVRAIVPREIVNLNKEKVQKYYEGWNIDEFTANEIKISRNNSGICEEHYILRESDGYISINRKNDIGEYIFKGLTDISVQYLPEEDLNRLEKGIEIVGKENLNKFLEDFE